MARMREHHKDQLLDALMHYLPSDVRGKIMREVPEAYNAYCEQKSGGAKPVVVVRRSDIDVALVMHAGNEPGEQIMRRLYALEEGR